MMRMPRSIFFFFLYILLVITGLRESVSASNTDLDAHSLIAPRVIFFYAKGNPPYVYFGPDYPSGYSMIDALASALYNSSKEESFIFGSCGLGGLSGESDFNELGFRRNYNYYHKYYTFIVFSKEKKDVSGWHMVWDRGLGRISDERMPFSAHYFSGNSPDRVLDYMLFAGTDCRFLAKIENRAANQDIPLAELRERVKLYVFYLDKFFENFHFRRNP